jgi:adenosylhomocysteine nucleosidase
MHRIAIVAALEREVLPLVRGWSVREQEHAGRRFRFLENGDCVLVCGGIGAEAARRATEAVIALYHPEIIYSTGFAGALDPMLKIGDIVVPNRVVNAQDGSRLEVESGEGVLVTFSAVASAGQKARLRESFAAQAVDMEAAAIVRAAEARGVRFAAVKAISDRSDFAFPEMDRFISPAGHFRTGKFVLFVMVRPWLWKSAWRLGRDSARASRALCDWLERVVANPDAKQAAPASTLEVANRQ